MNKVTKLSVGVFISSVVVLVCAVLVWMSRSKTEKSIGPSSVISLQEECASSIKGAEELLNSILTAVGDKNETNTLSPLNEISIVLGNMGSKAYLYANVHPNKQVRSDGEECFKKIEKLNIEISLNRKLFEACSTISPDGLDEQARRFLEKTVKDFKRAGVDKDEKTRETIRNLKNELNDIGLEFGRNIREDVRAIELTSVKDLDGLPEDYEKSHTSEKDGKIKITTDFPDYMPFLQYAKNDELRKKLFLQFVNRAYPKNMEVLNKLLKKRYELAQLLGYRNWAHYSTEELMTKTDERVAGFIDEVASTAEVRAKKELSLLLEEKKKHEAGKHFIGEWQRLFYEELVKKAKYSVDSQEVRKYFAALKVKEGLLDLTKKLFSLNYVKVNDAVVWDPSVEVYDVYYSSQPQMVIGRIYLDLYPREGKYKHFAQFGIKDGVLGQQIPEGAIVANFPQATKEDPGLMDHDDVVTFFHEFGHLLHHVLGGNQKWKRFSGVATEWDFVEVPSQLMEEWAWDPAVLQSFAHHYQTGKPIPPELIEQMRKAHDFGIGVFVRRQMFLAALSLNYYNQDPSLFDTTSLLKQLQTKYSPYPYTEGSHLQTNFGHLEGYSSNYYTYMWSLVIVKDLLNAFTNGEKKLDLLDPEIGRRYRDTILAPGGTKDAEDLVKDFLGRPFNYESFRSWLDNASI